MMVLSKQKLLALRELMLTAFLAMSDVDDQMDIEDSRRCKSALRWIRYIDRTLERDGA